MCGFRQTQWMTNNIIKYLKDRSKLTKYFYKNGHRESHHDKLLKKSAEYPREIFTKIYINFS